MTTLALIPARGGSKRIPRKNLVDVCGKPLVAWTIEAALKSDADEVYVSTDDDEIGDVAVEYGAGVIPRPAELATDSARMEDVVTHALGMAGEHWPVESFVILNPTSPLVHHFDINRALTMLEHYAGVVGVVRDPMSYFCGLAADDGVWIASYPDRPRTQDIHRYRESGGLFGARVDAWKRRAEFITEDTAWVEVPKERAVDVNDEVDLSLARLLLERRLARQGDASCSSTSISSSTHKST